MAFYDPSWEDESDTVRMRLYLITREQLANVMRQEGPSSNWYGRLICLEVDDNGFPVYTLTSESPRPENVPNPAYTDMMIKALNKECRYGLRDSRSYINKWMPKA